MENLELERNLDILDYLGKNNKIIKVVVGFSAETENTPKFKMKLKDKYCDLIVANDVSKEGIGFNSDYNKVSMIDNGKIALSQIKLYCKFNSSDNFRQTLMNDKILIKRLFKNVQNKVETEGSSGLDLVAKLDKDVNINPGEVEIIPTGSMSIPKGFEIQIRPRCGLAAKRSKCFKYSRYH